MARSEEELIKLLDSDAVGGKSKRQLALYRKKILDEEVDVICEYVKNHENIQRLNLAGNKITGIGATKLAGLLSTKNLRLQELNLNDNFIGDEGGVAFAKALRSNKVLKQLRLSNCRIQDDGGLAIADMILTNDSLVGLEIDSNLFSNPVTRKLADALNQNQRIASLLVGASRAIRDRLMFVRYMIQTENVSKPRTDAVLCFSKDRDNQTIDLILQEWRTCRKEGKKLIKLPKELKKAMQSFNRMKEDELEELHNKVKNFMESAREQGVGNLKRAKIIMMGRANSGKSSLTKSLINGRSILQPNGPDRATVSVEINPWSMEGVKCAIWDFGGQEEYYMTNSFFVSARCIVVLCVNLSTYDETEESFKQNVKYFIDSVQGTAPGAKFIIVGTHTDVIDYDETVIGSKCDHILDCFARGEEEEVSQLTENIKLLEKADGSSTQMFPSMLGMSSKFKNNLSDNGFQFDVEGAENDEDEEDQQLVSQIEDSVISQAGEEVRDKLRQDTLIKLKERKDNRPVIVGQQVFAVTSTEGLKGVRQLEEEIRDMIVQPEKYNISMEFPKTYVDLVDRIQAYVTRSTIGGNKSFLGFSKDKTKDKSRKTSQKQKLKPMIPLVALYKDFVGDRKKSFRTKRELENALSLLHDTGYILWFKNIAFLRDQVFVSPQWVVDMIKSVLRHNMFHESGSGRLDLVPKPITMSPDEYAGAIDDFKKRALLDMRVLREFPYWRDATEDEQFHLLALMEHFDLMFETPQDLLDKTSRPKYFIPLYLKTSFGQRDPAELEAAETIDLAQMLGEIKGEDEIPEPIHIAKGISSGLFDTGVTRSNLLIHNVAAEETVDQDGPSHIQWRYEFVKTFPEGMFLRMLVRCHPFISYDFQHPPSENLLKASTAGGVIVFLQEERDKYDIAGALVLTCIKSPESKSDLWEAFNLFAFAIEDLMSGFAGLESQVFITVMHPTIGRVILPRESIEQQQLNTWSKTKTKSISIIVEGEKVLLDHLVPSLYILPRGKKHPKGFQMTPELVRLSKVAMLNFSILNMREQVEQGSELGSSRVPVLARTMLDVIDLLLRNIHEATKARESDIYEDMDGGMKMVKSLNVKNMSEIQTGVDKLRNLTDNLFYNRKKMLATHINISMLKVCMNATEMLFDIQEDKMVNKAYRLKHRFPSVGGKFTRLGL
mmetsp:Transcript_15472/g.18054  ORF Transcript_15472/g.18054 Transcript_15472/m.18054 type:complete len:1172 (-) Transcript_15472:66-3581(-)